VREPIAMELGPVTATLTEIWRELFADDSLGPDADFLALGGTSLTAVGVRSRIRLRLGREVQVEAMFDHSTPADLAPHVLEAPEAEAEPGPDDGSREGVRDEAGGDGGGP